MDSWFPTFRRLANYRVPYPRWWPSYTSSWQRQSLLRLVAVAIEENLPLIPLLEQWAQDGRGAQRDRLQRLVRLLNGGRSLPAAVEEIPGILREEDLLSLRFDAQSGTRTAAVRALLDESQPATPSPVPRVRRSLIYFCTVVSFGLLVVAFMQLRIIPVFTRMFEEFSMEPPQVLQWSVQAASTFASFWWLGALAALALLWSLFSTRGGRLLRHSIFGRLLHTSRDLHSADVLEKIGVALSAGRPIPGALSTLARYHFDPTIRHKLLFVRNEVEQDADVWQSLTTVGLLTVPEVRLLKTAERVGNRPWALKQLVWVKKRRAMRRFQRAAEFLLPALVLIIGAFVLFQALTVFQPLKQLIEGLL